MLKVKDAQFWIAGLAGLPEAHALRQISHEVEAQRLALAAARSLPARELAEWRKSVEILERTSSRFRNAMERRLRAREGAAAMSLDVAEDGPIRGNS